MIGRGVGAALSLRDGAREEQLRSGGEGALAWTASGGARESGGERGGSGEGLALPSPCVTALGRDKTNEGRVRRSDGAG